MKLEQWQERVEKLHQGLVLTLKNYTEPGKSIGPFELKEKDNSFIYE